ncbi:SDR family NAD(P)-dependent oxidoreductase [Dactylosporangium sp. CS-033363]|uniref:SDR family NAD(P)-dependent oxidoreductase n=1 Tax=Dactylosporangium sp. CS-033363 TaxID=3239935 RepID=UPI003D929614
MDELQRTVVVTGGTDGIGRAVALKLGAQGDRVLFTGRDPGRAAGTLAGLPPGRGSMFLPADLSLMADTGRLADEIQARTGKIDALVCCAGCLANEPAWTAEGNEYTLALNVLSRLLLVERLQQRLANVVLVAAAGRYPDTLNFDDLQARKGGRGRWVSGRTQFANDLLAVELAERRPELGVFCVYPGLTRTAVFRNATGFPAPVRAVAMLVQRLVGRDPGRAAETPARLAGPERYRSGFYGPGLRPRAIPARARDPRRREQLWAAGQECLDV